MIYLSTAIGLSPGGSKHLHKNNTYTRRTTQITTETTQITTNVEECGSCPVLLRVLPWHLP